ncbi:hypothetical protein [Desulfosporosinus sp.]|uniref:hypothetical protein n=1 Tax=Desulfosporosinus sp. TaxID=157907 RepID=UPI0025B9EB10|nr:hypothetical protein [Desulfosporosinus sp.]MBC2726248.1 hypothetical protein [Desulfosporosinus sp.]
MAILKDLIRDLKGIVVPQYLKEDGSDFEALKGKNGALNVNAYINGSLANNQTNKVVTANANILASNYTPSKYSKSVLQVATNTAGVLSLVVDGVSGTLNSGEPLVANAWYEFEISLLSSSTYNLKLSVGATMQVKWQVI